MICKGINGVQYKLSDKPFGQGGEGEIYDIVSQNELCAKIYKPDERTQEKDQKLRRMIATPPTKDMLNYFAWPEDVLFENGDFVGFVMKKFDIREYKSPTAINEYPPHDRECAQLSLYDKILIARNICAVLDAVHKLGHVVGDLNPNNIYVNVKQGYVLFVDVDSFHIKDGSKTYRCGVGMKDYIPAEIQKRWLGNQNLSSLPLPTFTEESDNFALAIHIFQLLMNGVNPFACAILRPQRSVVAPQPSDNILKGFSPFWESASGIEIPSFAMPLTVLPSEIQALFYRAFRDGYRNPSARPSPEEWFRALERMENNLKRCAQVRHHYYYKGLSSCPFCEIDIKFEQTMQTAFGPAPAFPSGPARPLVTAPIRKPSNAAPKTPPKKTSNNSSFSLIDCLQYGASSIVKAIKWIIWVIPLCICLIVILVSSFGITFVALIAMYILLILLDLLTGIKFDPVVFFSFGQDNIPVFFIIVWTIVAAALLSELNSERD